MNQRVFRIKDRNWISSFVADRVGMATLDAIGGRGAVHGSKAWEIGIRHRYPPRFSDSVSVPHQ